MQFVEIELPSNRKFGFFVSFAFILAAVYFYHAEKIGVALTFALASLVFLLITLIKSDALLPLNKLWMWLGLSLGMIISPIVLGIIFFGLFASIAMIFRLIGRDELRLKFTPKVSHWRWRAEPITSESFKRQF